MAAIEVDGGAVLGGIAIVGLAFHPNKSTDVDASQSQAYREISVRQLASGDSLGRQDATGPDVPGRTLVRDSPRIEGHQYFSMCSTTSSTPRAWLT